MEMNVPTKPEWNGWCDYTYGKIQLSVEEWCHCLCLPEIFKEKEIELIEKMH